MSIGILRKRGWKRTLGGTLAAISAATPFVWAGAAGLRGLPGVSGAVQAAGGGWKEICTALLPNVGAMTAGALLLLPFGLSTLRFHRRR